EVPPEEQEALAILDLPPEVTLVELKSRYKILVKRHHPDANGGDRQAEERLKAINRAYSTLRKRLAA
ncbi:MAG: J domain-containing protein, partial [Proteobacteria bacterium]|nr:J domain-containing protein [Pseudomonadota bacterium]